MSSASTGGTEGSSPASSPASASSLAMAAPKFGTLVPNRIFVGGISASTSEADLAQLFSAYGNVKATKIISDRAGVSKGYGFVTFETDEEARRLQQESECIVLRERKLNIAPAIKKQPFNRSFDGGSGSPPAVPASTYYYTNGMGLTYQNGVTFYNPGAPAPGTPIAPPTDPATIYQAAGVFGPQATPGHQTFAPVMYSCPAPSLYMPQQYQYSPMPQYESYYAGVAAAGGPPQYTLYASNGVNQQQQQQQQQHQSQQAQTNGTVVIGGNGNGSVVTGGGLNGTGASSPPALGSLQSGQPQFYAPTVATGPQAHHHHHHPTVATGPPAPPQPQLDHLYYSFATPGPQPLTAQQTQHQTIGITDQPLLLYTTDPNGGCQQLNPTGDNQTTSQEDNRSTSSHSDHPKHQHQTDHQHPQPHQQTHQHQLSTTPLVSLMPLKYPIMPARYANYHHLAVHPSNPQHQHQHQQQQQHQQHQQQQQQQSHHPMIQHHLQNSSNSGSPGNSLNSERSDIEESSSPSPLQRPQTAPTTYIYPTTVYVPHGTGYQTTGGPTSLLPTPGTAYEASIKIQQNSQTCSGKSSSNVNNTIGINIGYHPNQNNCSMITGIQHHVTTKNPGYSRKYGNNSNVVNNGDRNRYHGNKFNLSSQQYSYVTPRSNFFGNQIITDASTTVSNVHVNNPMNSNGRRSLTEQWSDWYENVATRYGNTRRRENSTHGRNAKNFVNRSHNDNVIAKNSDPNNVDTKNFGDNGKKKLSTVGNAKNDETTEKIVTIRDNDNTISPPPAPYSPMTRPIPNISPPVSQVQFFPTGNQSQNRYHQPVMSHHQSHHHQQQQQVQQQQQQSGQRRYAGLGQSVNVGRKPSGSQSQTVDTSRRPKNKVNGGNLQSVNNAKITDENCLGGGGDATGSNVGNRMPITPPATPRNPNNPGSVGNDGNQMNETCHQIQTLSL